MQKQQRQPNPKSWSEKYSPEEDTGCGFPIEPPKGLTQNVYSHSGQLKQTSTLGTIWSRMASETEHLAGSGPFGAPRRAADLRNLRSYFHPDAASLSRFSNSVAARGWSQLDCRTESWVNTKWGNDSGKHDWSTLLDSSKATYKKDEHLTGKDFSVVKKYWNHQNHWIN